VAQIKTKSEIAKLKKAAAIAIKIYRSVSKEIKPGMAERDAAQKIEHAIREAGLKRSFKTIVASGPNAAMPHARPTDRKIGKRDVVVIDFGVVYRGYRSDLTRTVVFGKMPSRMKKAYSAVAEAQALAIRQARPGAVIADLASAAHGFMRKKGFGDAILHSLGHGVGRKIHEAPKLSEKNRHILRKSMLVTIEPGLYIKGSGGVRIEDMVLITENGSKVLTK